MAASESTLLAKQLPKILRQLSTLRSRQTKIYSLFKQFSIFLIKNQYFFPPAYNRRFLPIYDIIFIMKRLKIKEAIINTANILIAVAIIFAIGKLLKIPYSYSVRGENFSLAQALHNIAASDFFLNQNDDSGDPENKAILVLGIPGGDNSAPDLTDTIMLAVVSQSQKKLILFSIPRDLWVKTPDSNYETKINALYQVDKKNLSYIKQKISQISGLAVDNYIVFNLAGVEQIVDQLGGIEIEVQKDIYDFQFPGPNYSYETFVLLKGKQALDGKTAVKYVRTRHPDSDFGRIMRQQQLLKAVSEKVLSNNPIWNFSAYLNTFNAARKHTKTDLSLVKLKNLWDTVYQVGSENIQTFTLDNLDGKKLVIGQQINLAEGTTSIILPVEGKEKYEKIQKAIKNIIEKNL